MAKQTINVGTTANDRTGDTLRSSFTKINENFTELYNAGAANTGNITFEGTAIVGSTGILPQGSIELVPNDGTIPTGQPNAGDTYTSWGQYLQIYPTWNADAPHIHIAAGSGENSAGDLFLGNDLKYVQVNHNGTISIGNSIGEWKFYDAEGMSVLELPNNTTTTPTAEIIHRHADLDIRTTRTAYGIDADIGIYAADDIWLDAEGDGVEIRAANSISIISSTSLMSQDDWGVSSGSWNGTTLTFQTSETGAVAELVPYLSNTGLSVWFEVNDADNYYWIETFNTAVATVDGSTYTVTVDQNNAMAPIIVTSIKLVELNYGGSKEWQFRRDGSTIFPQLSVNLHNGGDQNAQTLQFGTNGIQAVITGPTPNENQNAERLIIQGHKATGTGEGGDVYVWGGDAQTNGGDIKIYAGDADSGSTGQGGYVNIDGGSGYDNGGDVSINAGNSTTNGGNIFISGGYGGAQGGSVQIGVSGGAHNTIFHHDGGITIPLGPGILKNVQSVSTGGLPPINITGNVVFADANAAGDHITLLLPTPIATGIEITVKNINSGGFSVNVLASTDDSVAIEALDGTISTSTSGILYGNCHATWVFDGSTWRITNRFTT